MEIDELWNEAEKLALRPYDIKVDEDQDADGSLVFMAYNPELPGCKAEASTQLEAIENLVEARIDYIYALLVSKLPVPEPNSYVNTTGQSPTSIEGQFSGGVITFDFQSGSLKDLAATTTTDDPSRYPKESSSTKLRGDLVKQT